MLESELTSGNRYKPAAMAIFLRCIPPTLGLLILAACGAREAHPGRTIGIEKYAEARDLYNFAEAQRRKYGWPALGVGIIHRGKIIGLGMAGERKAGSENWATIEDRFTGASCAKSMTATVAAMLVEEGKLRWNTKIVEVFPEWQKTILPAYTNVTLEQLLEHRSGLDQWMNSNPRWVEWHRAHANKTATEKRELFAVAALQRNPRHPPGSQHYYCNDGYLIAGSIIEKVSNVPFEDLLRERLFKPLELGSMRFGPATEDGNKEVWGHEGRWLGGLKPVKDDAAEYGDPPFGSPGGFLYCTLPDLLRYVDFHNRGANQHGKLLKPESFDRLYTPPADGQYALGWEVQFTRDTAGKVVERSIYHGGYSGRFRANMWFCPESGWGTVIFCNDGRGEGKEMGDVFRALLKETKVIK
jgi:CubicO group peptidase (beta-lactamase class C family)